ALCAGRDTAGTAVKLLPVDKTVAVYSVDNLHGYPFNTNPATTASATFNGTTVTLSANFAGNLNGYLVQIPAGTATTPGGFWYKVTGVTTNTLTISPAFKD